MLSLPVSLRERERERGLSPLHPPLPSRCSSSSCLLSLSYREREREERERERERGGERRGGGSLWREGECGEGEEGEGGDLAGIASLLYISNPSLSLLSPSLYLIFSCPCTFAWLPHTSPIVPLYGGSLCILHASPLSPPLLSPWALSASLHATGTSYLLPKGRGGQTMGDSYLSYACLLSSYMCCLLC